MLKLQKPDGVSLPPSDLRYLKGVGPKRALALEKLGVRSVHDLLYFFPRRYEDRTHLRSIAELKLGESATICGEVVAVKLRPIRRISLLDVTIGDTSGILHAVWFNQPYLKNHFSVGQQIYLFGKIELYQNRLQINSPEYELVEPGEESIHTGRITPIYPLTEGLFQRSLRSTLRECLEHQLENHVMDFLPESYRIQKDLMGLREAVREMHFPSSFEQAASARHRLVFDEFLYFETLLLKKIEQMKSKYRAHVLSDGKKWREAFETALPFKLTPSQSKAMEDLTEELAHTYPMNRLLQGDVGSGKTVLAAFALLLAAKNELQGAMLVPTEILAEQHYRTLRRFLEPLSLRPSLLTSSTPDAQRERIVAELRQGKIAIIVGTHAILQKDIQFQKLAVLVIDEQHKFGVYQRCQLLHQDPRPHQLVMTATPIPRTLALTLYGDLEVSVMKEMPAGRQPIKTYWIARNKQTAVLAHILEKIQDNQEQAYFIFPLIQETEKSDMLAAQREFENLKRGIFSKIKLGLVHGRLSVEDRDSVMKAFARGEIQVLIATSVIEVGVDNPNATMMVIENAERFGLAQLHQMRGRIGRGSKASECFLFGEPKTEEGKKRLEILVKSQDGFWIAEEDLRLRGPGDFWGSRQSGEPMFRLANPIEDEKILIEARELALSLIKENRIGTSEEWLLFKKSVAEKALRY